MIFRNRINEIMFNICVPIKQIQYRLKFASGTGWDKKKRILQHDPYLSRIQIRNRLYGLRTQVLTSKGNRGVLCIEKSARRGMHNCSLGVGAQGLRGAVKAEGGGGGGQRSPRQGILGQGGVHYYKIAVLESLRDRKNKEVHYYYTGKYIKTTRKYFIHTDTRQFLDYFCWGKNSTPVR